MPRLSKVRLAKVRFSLAALASLMLVTGVAVHAAPTEIKLVNPSFEEPASGVRAPGWSPTQHTGPERNYEWAVDSQTASDGKSSYRIKRLSPQAFGMINQAVIVAEHAGKTLEFSAAMKTDAVGAEGWLLNVNIETRNTILEQVRSAPVTGKKDWVRAAVRFKLPANAYELKLGVMLLDSGTGWVDDVKLIVVD